MLPFAAVTRVFESAMPPTVRGGFDSCRMAFKRVADVAELDAAPGKRLFLDALTSGRDWNLRSKQKLLLSDADKRIRAHLDTLLVRNEWRTLIARINANITANDFSDWRVCTGYPKTMDIELASRPFDAAMPDCPATLHAGAIINSIDWFWRHLVHREVVRTNPDVSVVPWTSLTESGKMQLHLSCAIICTE